jgi:ribosomal protein S18 acetylase RimI-like enzyme
VSCTVVFDPTPEDLRAIDRGLHEYNVAHLGQEVVLNYQRVAVLACDEQGDVMGGIHGGLVWEWLHIQSLWVAEGHRGRGIGSSLVASIERTAISRGFFHSHLETTDFQALGFYLKNGYEIFGELEGKPAGATWYYLKKDLGGGPCD